MSDKIARDRFGVPKLTKAQTERAHKYAAAMVHGNGTTRRTCSPLLLSAALCELAMHAGTVRWQLEQFITGSAQCAPAKDVAKLAVQMLTRMQTMTPADQFAYLQALLGDADEAYISNDRTTH